MASKLLSTTSYVEAPFIQVLIGDHSFGVFKKEKGTGAYLGYTKYKYPNFIKSLNVVKINGTLNTYTLTMIYLITSGDDPNFLEKIFSQQSNTRRMIISYGDYALPSFAYRKEGATITNIKSAIDFNNSNIVYTITAISDALSLTAGNFDFPKRVDKPSNVIKELLYERDNDYHLQEVFYGMRNERLVELKGLLNVEDKLVEIPAKLGITIFDYLNFLINCMSSQTSTSDNIIKDSKYILTIHDDLSNDLGGPYFKISKVATSAKALNSLDTYEVTIGYPEGDPIVSFSIEDDLTYSILYNYSQKINQSNSIYRINNNGVMETLYSPLISNSKSQFKTEETNKTWWTLVTQYPIKATLVLKGLLRSAMLMTYIRVNVYFYGQKHISSGTYIITRLTDDISENGFRTTLNLTRIQGD